jgi:hypothetical protein
MRDLFYRHTNGNFEWLYQGRFIKRALESLEVLDIAFTFSYPTVVEDFSNV